MLSKDHIITNNGITHLNIPYSVIASMQNGSDQHKIVLMIIDLIKHNKIGFPFKRHFMKSPEHYYNNIFSLDLTLESKEFKFRNIIPKMRFELFEKVFSYKYDNKYLYVRDSYETYESINILPDYFTEKPRVESRGHGEQQSPMELWNTNMYKILREVIKRKQDVTSYNLREAIYNMVVEARMSKTSQYVTLYNFFKAKRILDPSCAWGDRLIAAIAYNASYYLGIDPNKDLIPGHKEIIETFASASKEKFQIVYKPFEEVELKTTFDFIISSPAPFEGDYYGNREGQSTDTFKNYNDWYVNYMFVTCVNSYKVLEDKGHFLITVLDRLYPKPYAVVELILLSVLYACPKMFYKGVIGWEASKGKVVPFWVFQREEKTEHSNKVKFAKEALQNYYPDIFKRIEQTVSEY